MGHWTRAQKLKPRYVRGTGEPPLYLSSIQRQSDKSVWLIFIVKGMRKKYRCHSESMLQEVLQILVNERIAMSIGGHSPGSADEIAIMMDQDTLRGRWVQIFWTKQGEWVVREELQGTLEWQEVDSINSVVSTDIEIDSLLDGLSL